MKIVNIMNFARKSDFRIEDSENYLFNTTKTELELVNQYGYENTFLLQYDALIDPRYIELFKTEATEKTELGLWYEIVRPLTNAVGLAWRSKENSDWDWHIVPGFSQAYTQEERERLADAAMNKFKEIYGYYPKTIASWMIDSYTILYLSEHYDISTFAICRDQTSTDAYTFVGGYFNQAYYPSKMNVFTPAQTDECRINVPVFRLLGPDPIHNYDSNKYLVNEKYLPYRDCYTLEPVFRSGYDEEIVNWFFDTYFKNEDLGFSYAQLGQENSFGIKKIKDGLCLQMELLKEFPDVTVEKMSDTGERFKKAYKNTPPTSVCALNDWDGSDRVQSVYYDCQNYTANIFRFNNKIFIRCMYLFDESVCESYYDKPCETWDATYENLPITDTLLWEDDSGIVLDTNATAFSVCKNENGDLEVYWEDKKVIFSEDSVAMFNVTPDFCIKGAGADIILKNNKLCYEYKGNKYALNAVTGTMSANDDHIYFKPQDGCIRLIFERKE